MQNDCWVLWIWQSLGMPYFDVKWFNSHQVFNMYSALLFPCFRSVLRQLERRHQSMSSCIWPVKSPMPCAFCLQSDWSIEILLWDIKTMIMLTWFTLTICSNSINFTLNNRLEISWCRLSWHARSQTLDLPSNYFHFANSIDSAIVHAAILNTFICSFLDLSKEPSSFITWLVCADISKDDTMLFIINVHY